MYFALTEPNFRLKMGILLSDQFILRVKTLAKDNFQSLTLTATQLF